MSIFVVPAYFIPLYPVSPAKLSMHLPVILSICCEVASTVFPSYSFLKETVARIIPENERIKDTFVAKLIFFTRTRV